MFFRAAITIGSFERSYVYACYSIVIIFFCQQANRPKAIRELKAYMLFILRERKGAESSLLVLCCVKTNTPPASYRETERENCGLLFSLFLISTLSGVCCLGPWAPCCSSGRYPQDPRASSEEHFQKIAAMHQHMKVPSSDMYPVCNSRLILASLVMVL